MADYLPRFKPGEAVSMGTSADVTGGRLVIPSGVNTVAPATADAANVVGIAGTDATSGDKVLVFTRAGGIQKLTASAAISAGARVVAATGGKIATIASNSNPIGIALQTAAADGDVIDVLFL
jgi:hypothetical protein